MTKLVLPTFDGDKHITAYTSKPSVDQLLRDFNAYSGAVPEYTLEPHKEDLIALISGQINVLEIDEIEITIDTFDLEEGLYDFIQ